MMSYGDEDETNHVSFFVSVARHVVCLFSDLHLLHRRPPHLMFARKLKS